MVFELKRGLSDQEWAEVSQWVYLIDNPHHRERTRQTATWVVDHERHAYFVAVCAQIGPIWERPSDEWYLLWNGRATKVDTWDKSVGDDDVGVDVLWWLGAVRPVEPPAEGDPDQPELESVVKEALMVYGPGPRARRGTVTIRPFTSWDDLWHTTP